MASLVIMGRTVRVSGMLWRELCMSWSRTEVTLGTMCALNVAAILCERP